MAMRQYTAEILVDTRIGCGYGDISISFGFKEFTDIGGHAIQSRVEYEKLISVLIPGIGKIIDRIEYMDSCNNHISCCGENILWMTAHRGTLKPFNRRNTYKLNVFILNATLYFLS